MDILEPKLLNSFTLQKLGATAASVTTHRLNVSDANRVWVLFTMTNAAASGDIGAVNAFFVTPAGAVTTVPVPKAQSIAVTYAAGLAVVAHQFDVAGLALLNLSMTNGAASARNIEIHVFKG